MLTAWYNILSIYDIVKDLLRLDRVLIFIEAIYSKYDTILSTIDEILLPTDKI